MPVISLAKVMITTIKALRKRRVTIKLNALRFDGDMGHALAVLVFGGILLQCDSGCHFSRPNKSNTTNATSITASRSRS